MSAKNLAAAALAVVAITDSPYLLQPKCRAIPWRLRVR